MLAAIVVVGAVSLLQATRETPDRPRVLMCPGPHSAEVFDDARSLCASRGTALARNDGSGHVTYFTDPDTIPCTLPSFRVLGESVTKVTGRGRTHCDTDTAGTSLHAFPHCSLTMNYPGNEDYLEGLPIGLLVKPYDC